MNTLLLLHSFLLIHLAGVVFFIGTTVNDFIVLRQFLGSLSQGPVEAKNFTTLTAKFPMMIGIGILLIVITAVGMMAITHGLFGGQLWLRIKFPLVVLAILNGVFVGRRQGIRLRETLNLEQPPQMDRIVTIVKGLKFFYVTQFILFAIILTLSVFKFS